MVDNDRDFPLVTTITGSFEQAALQGLLRWLYTLGLPVISVVYLESDSEDN